MGAETASRQWRGGSDPRGELEGRPPEAVTVDQQHPGSRTGNLIREDGISKSPSRGSEAPSGSDASRAGTSGCVLRPLEPPGPTVKEEGDMEQELAMAAAPPPALQEERLIRHQDFRASFLQAGAAEAPGFHSEGAELGSHAGDLQENSLRRHFQFQV